MSAAPPPPAPKAPGRVWSAVRAIASAVCWTLAVVSAFVTAGSFAGGGHACQEGKATSCPPQTWPLLAGIALAAGFGVAGALLWKPRPKRKFDWMEDFHKNR